MSDLTLLFYTANRVGEPFATNVRRHLRTVAPSAPLISVSQRPLEFGRNVCVGEIGASVFNCYRQILVGAQQVTTPFVACCEDDVLYAASHFAVRPSAPERFLYDANRWWLEPDGLFYLRRRTSMLMCVCATELLVRTLTARFAAADGLKARWWSEPGRYEHHLGLPSPEMEFVDAADPSVLVNHAFPSLGGQRPRLSGWRGHQYPADDGVPTLTPWGDGASLWRRLHGEES